MWEKVGDTQQKMFDNLFICHLVSTSVLFLMQNCFIEYEKNFQTSNTHEFLITF